MIDSTKDRDGVGHTLIRKMEDALGDLSSFRTRLHKEPGREVMLRTKGGKPEVTEKRDPVQIQCIKGPLTEIAFKYVNPTAVSGYRRWYGEPDPAASGGVKDVRYEWSSDGLLCIEARKLQKLCCLDGNGVTADFLFAEKPEDRSIPASALPPVDTTISSARFKFVEGKYPDREWYGSNLADIGWAFSGPTVDGVAVPEPANAVKFFTRRLRSIMFNVSDALGKIASSKIKWIFTDPTTTDRTVGSETTACANQNAREVSFVNRHFYSMATDGNMDKVTLSIGIDEPPAIIGGPSFSIDLKKPGSFLAAIDPEGAIGNTRPTQVEKAIDLCEFSAFGNPYHGLYWKQGSSAAVLYTDSTRSAQWPFTPSTALSGGDLTHRYYNVKGKDPLVADNQIRTSNPADGVMLPDALIVGGAWYVKDPDFIGWGQLQYFEWLYKDPDGTVWVMRYDITGIARAYNQSLSSEDDAIITVRVTLLRRFGILGTDFSGVSGTNDINRVIATLTFTEPKAWQIGAGFVLTLFREYSFVCAPDARQIMVVSRSFIKGNNVNSIKFAYLVTMDGVGARKADATNHIAIGDGINISGSIFPINSGLSTVASGVTINVLVLDLFHEDGQWNRLEATNRTDYNTPRNYLAKMYKNGTELFAISSDAAGGSLYIFPVLAQPEVIESGYQQIPDSNDKPLAWTIGKAWGDTTSIASRLVYRGVSIPIDQATLQPFVHSDGKTYSATVGWAFDYRSKELITVPFGTVAYFI